MQKESKKFSPALGTAALLLGGFKLCSGPGFFQTSMKNIELSPENEASLSRRWPQENHNHLVNRILQNSLGTDEPTEARQKKYEKCQRDRASRIPKLFTGLRCIGEDFKPDGIIYGRSETEDLCGIDIGLGFAGDKLIAWEGKKQFALTLRESLTFATAFNAFHWRHSISFETGSDWPRWLRLIAQAVPDEVCKTVLRFSPAPDVERMLAMTERAGVSLSYFINECLRIHLTELGYGPKGKLRPSKT